MSANPAPSPTRADRPSRRKAERRSLEEHLLERWLSTHGDLLSDLLQSVLGSPHGVRAALHSVIREALKNYDPSYAYEIHERAWLLRIAIRALKRTDDLHARRLSAPEQLMLDATLAPDQRLRYLESYLQRLSLEDQLVLLLAYKHGLALAELALALDKSEGAVALQLAQTLRVLSELISGAQVALPSGAPEEISPLGEQIAHALAQAPRHTLAPELRQQPKRLLTTLRLATPSAGSPLGRLLSLERLPWYLRTSLEGIGIAALVLLAVAAVPRLRSWYEQNRQDRLQAILALDPNLKGYFDAQSSGTPALKRGVLGSVPLEDPAGTAEAGGASETPVIGSDEEAGTGGDEDLADLSSEGNGTAAPTRVGSSEIWRFILKTDSPHDLRTRVIGALKAAGAPASDPALGGIEAPGGIQFDILLASDQVLTFRTQLASLIGVDPTGAQTAPQNAPTDPNAGEAPALTTRELGAPFTWYKNKSRKPLPSGRTRVVIWLSQI